VICPRGEVGHKAGVDSFPVQLTVSNTIGSSPVSYPYSGIASVARRERNNLFVA
jgi:hypothetical protein